MTFTDVTLAKDLSLNGPGFAVLAVSDDKEPILLECTCIKSDTSKPHGFRLNRIEDEIERLITKYNPEHIVREKGFSRFAAMTQALYKVVGVSDNATYRKTSAVIDEISPTTVKKEIAGNGKATKEEIAEAVFRIMRIDNRDEFYGRGGKLIDDKTDAIAVGLTYLKQKKLIEL